MEEDKSEANCDAGASAVGLGSHRQTENIYTVSSILVIATYFSH